MTSVELKQPLVTFTNAGASAYRALIHIGNNPYNQKPYKQLWAKGWFAAKAKHEGTAPKHTPRVDRPKKERTEGARPLLSFNRINKFNNKHRTQA